ncbi:hypothetical protein M8J76_016529 [Diaphorina citri]|nr:hypothetical protein M8J76_016529 [Diaphorina citri]
MHWTGRKLFIFDPNVWYCLFGIWLLFWLWRRRKLYYISWQLSGPLALPLIGNLFSMLGRSVTKIIPLTDELLKTFGGSTRMIRLWAATDLYIIVADASVANQVNALALTKADFYEHFATPYMRKGILVDTNVPHWRASRKVVTRVFHYSTLKAFLPIFHEESRILVEKMRRYARGGSSFHPPRLMVLATFSTIMRTTLGINTHAQLSEEQPFIVAMHTIMQHMQRKMMYPFLRSILVSTILGYRQEEMKAIRTLLELSQSVLDNAERSVNKESDERLTLSQVLLQTPHMTRGERNAQILTVVGAGLDTSMFQNSILLVFLAIHPDIQNKVYEEIIQTLGDNTSSCPSYEDLMKLDYLEMVLKETLRMSPAGIGTARKVTEDIKVTSSDGKQYTFPTGVTIVTVAEHIHRSSHYYDRPDVFDPDRWLPERSSQRDPQCFLPFMTGPRNCIGGKYALLQMKVFTVSIVREFEVLPVEAYKTMAQVEEAIRLNFTLDLDEPCHIRLRERRRKD